MTTRRYEHYRRALGMIEAIGSEGVSHEYQEVLREIAQDHLLSRSEHPESAEELDTDAAAALDHMTATGLLSLDQADELRRTLRACGPGPGDASRVALAGSLR